MAVFWRLQGHAFRRLGWGVADQAVSSLTNFAVAIYVVRTLGAVQFGAFSLAYVTYAFALNASRGVATDPLLVRFSGTDLLTWRRAVASCTGTAAAVGLASGACVLVAATVLHGTTRGAFLALGLTLPGLLLQDSWRYSFFALGRGSRAFLNDMVWALALLPALALLRVTGHEDVFWFVLAWGSSAAVAAAVGPFQAQVIPKLSGTRAWLSRHRDLGSRYFAEGTTWSAVSQLRTYGIGLILGLAALGYVQAASTLMGPLTVLFLGMSLVAIPEAARVLRRSPGRLPLFCVLVSGGLAAAALAWGIVLLVALPKGLGESVLGPIWRQTYPLVLPQALFLIGQGAGVGSGAGLHALGAARRSLRAMVLISAIYLVCSLVGAVAGGIDGTMRGAAAAAWIGALISWWQLRAAVREFSAAADGRQIEGILVADPEPADRTTGRVPQLTRPTHRSGPTRLTGTPNGHERHAEGEPDDGEQTVSDADQAAALLLSDGDDLPVRFWDFGGLPADEDRSAAALATGLASVGYIRAALRRGAWLWCALAVVGSLAGLGTFKEFPPAYQASTSILLANSPSEIPGEAALDDQAIAQSRTVAGAALRKLGLHESAASFVGHYTVTIVTNRVLDFTVKATSSEVAVRQASALATAFLAFQAQQLEAQERLVDASLQQQITQAQQRLSSINKQIRKQPASATLRNLLTKRSKAASALPALEQANAANEAATRLSTTTVINGSQVLDPAAPIAHSRRKLLLIYVASGLIAGLALGLSIVVVRALVSDRLRRRDDIARALGAPVKLSVGRIRLSRWLPGQRGLAAADNATIRRIVVHLGNIVAGNFRGPAALAVVPVDNPQVAALALVSLAVSCAQQAGMQVVVADLCRGTPAAHLLGATGPGVHSVTVNDAELVVAIPEHDDVVPVGPLQPLLVEEAPGPLRAAFASADLLLTLVPLDPSLGGDHLVTWATGAVAMVTAGQSTETRIHAVGEMIRLARMPLISAVLVGADKSDESLGVTNPSGPPAPAGPDLGTSGRPRSRYISR
jgi:capsular polysaccharide biosynthesis protein/O-antigen/teichoic acid export membrane protein